MSHVAHVEQALHKASVDTSRLMSAHLRSETQASGWPHEVTRHLHVSYNGDSFNVHAHKTHADEVHKLEYGTPDTQPTAAIRRFANRTSEANKFLLARFNQHMGGSL